MDLVPVLERALLSVGQGAVSNLLSAIDLRTAYESSRCMRNLLSHYG